MDIDQFLAWHTAKVKRRTGRPPAASTLRSTRTRLNTALRGTHSTELQVLVHTTASAPELDALFDRLSLTNSSGSLRLIWEALKPLNEYGRAQGIITEPLAIEPPAKNPQPPIVVYSKVEVERIVEAARGKSLRWFIFLATVAHTGRRVGEVLGLRWEWLHLESEIPHFELPHTKNKRQHYVPLDPFLIGQAFTPANIELLRDEQHSRFRRPPAEYPFPWSYTSVEKQFRRHCERIGVEDKGFHRFRHTLATSMLVRGVPLQAVSSLIGHANVATTDRLYHHATSLDYAKWLTEPN